jgi:hypothetical protein
MKEKVASQLPGLAVVRARRELAWVSPYVSDREIGIVNLVIELRRNGRAGDLGSHFVCVALDQGVYKCSGGCLWIGIESTIVIESSAMKLISNATVSCFRLWIAVILRLIAYLGKRVLL